MVSNPIAKIGQRQDIQKKRNINGSQTLEKFILNKGKAN